MQIIRSLLLFFPLAAVLSFTTTTKKIATTKTTFHQPEERSVTTFQISSLSLRLQSKKNDHLLLAPNVHEYDEEDKNHAMIDINSPFNPHSSTNRITIHPGILMSTAFIVANLFPYFAEAAEPDWGLFEGRIASLLHPIAMFSLLAYSMGTALLGFQWRRQRTMGDRIAAFKKKLETVRATDDEEFPIIRKEFTPFAHKLVHIMAYEAKIADLEIEQKNFRIEQKTKANPRDQHYSQGAFLTIIGTAFAIEVCFFSSFGSTQWGDDGPETYDRILTSTFFLFFLSLSLMSV